MYHDQKCIYQQKDNYIFEKKKSLSHISGLETNITIPKNYLSNLKITLKNVSQKILNKIHIPMSE